MRMPVPSLSGRASRNVHLTGRDGLHGRIKGVILGKRVEREVIGEMVNTLEGSLHEGGRHNG